MYQYSNSLIRQFPSLVTGNAAVGVQATVYVGETNTLAQLFEVNGAPKTNPVTTDSKGFYSFSVADGDYRIVFSSSQFATLRISVLDGAQIREDFDALVVSNTAFRNEQQAAYDAFVISQGWDQVGTFAAGFTYASPNQVGQDVGGNCWRWNGTFPKVVTAGTLPSSDANYKLVGDGVLRSDLADGTGDVGGLASGIIAKRVARFVTPQEFAGGDRAKLIAALTSGFNVDLRDFNYNIATPISVNVPNDLKITASGAAITYSGTHAETALQINFTGAGKAAFSGFTVDGGKLCNKPIEIRNLSSMATATTLTLKDVFAAGAKRLNTFNGGDGLRIVGAFNKVTLKQSGASDCELPAGQGTSGSIGVSGIAVDFSGGLYCKKVVADGIRVEKVYSSDPAYKDDQDGLQYFAPFVSGSTVRKMPSTLIVKGGSTFNNCYGRSVKTQCRTTIVQDSEFERTEGGASIYPEIDAQYGQLFEHDNTYDYQGGNVPNTCVLGTSGDAKNQAGLNCQNSVVTLDDATTLPYYAATFPRDGTHAQHIIDSVKVNGTTRAMLLLRCNSVSNLASVTSCYVSELAAVSGERNFIYIEALGLTGPFGASVVAERNTYAGANTAAIARDFISGSAMQASVSSVSNFGFVNDRAINPDVNGQKLNQCSISTAERAGVRLGGYESRESALLAAGTTKVFDVNNVSGARLFFNSRFNKTAWADFVSDIDGNTVIQKGAAVEVGNATEPVSGTFRIWSSGVNKISVKNTDSTDRYVFLKVLSA